MPDISRRFFITGTAALPFLAWLDGPLAARASMSLVRYDARSTKGQAMLKTYAEAVAAMKKTAEGKPLGWLFQWYTHWVKGSTTKTMEISRIYPAPSTEKDLAQSMWDTCQAHGGGNENFFLPWHRMFVYYFEDIIRAVSGDNSFTLPYWNYSAPDSPIRGVIPPEFTKQGDPTFGSLYVDNRNPGVNKGQPIQQGQPGDPLSTSSLAQCLYEPQGVNMGFCLTLDSGLHGNVHVLVGDGQNMGSVPWAANDPIFWLHHCNIDRLWASWNAAGRTNPALQQKFVFADKDRKQVVKDVADFLDTAKLGYTYDELEQVPKCPKTPEEILAATKTEKKVAMVKTTSVKLGADPVLVTLEPLPDKEGEPPGSFTDRVTALKEGRRFFLVLKNLHADAQPGVLYHVYLDLPPDATDEQKKAHYVGSVNFFDAVPHGDHQHDKPPKEGTEKFLSFDITDLAKTLQSMKVLTEKPTLMIAPAGRPADEAKPVIGDVSIVEH